MSEPANLSEVRLQPIPALVEMLRDLLARAESGQLRSVALASECEQSSITTAYAGHLDVWRLVGAIEELKMRLLARPTIDDIEALTE